MNLLQLKETLGKFIKDEHLDLNEVLVGAGAAIMLLGGREVIDDIDINVPTDIFNKYKGQYGGTRLIGGGGECVDVNKLSLHRHTNEDAVLVDGFYCYTIKGLIEQKEYLVSIRDKPQDLIDLKFLRSLIKIAEVEQPREYSNQWTKD